MATGGHSSDRRLPASATRIDSLTDQRVSDYALIADAAALRRAGLFVGEGRLVVARLLASSRFTTRSVLVTPAAARALAAELDAHASRIPLYVVEQQIMNGLTGFNMHRGCLALAERPATATLSDAAAVLATARRILVLEGVNNPDNVGGLFRSAAAFGVELVVLAPGCSDPLYRKAIRTSMAATLQVPFVEAAVWPAALQTISGHGLHLVALTPAGDASPLPDIPKTLPRVALLVGSEGDGVSPEALACAHHRTRIPMAEGVDSLNVTVATSIALYHFAL